MSLDFTRVRKIYREFFDRAERKRRWNVETDIPWDQISTDIPDDLVELAETFYAVESYLPDYSANLIPMIRSNRGRTWFHEMWGYEESKHSLAFETWLVRAGHRTEEQMDDLTEKIHAAEWTPPFDTPRQMAVYQCIQEAETWMVYRNFAKLADDAGDPALAQVLRLLMVDEREHYNFFRTLIALEMESDPQAAADDLYYVASQFKMPAHDLIPDWKEREVHILSRKLTSNMGFLREVWKPLCEKLGVPLRPKEPKKIVAFAN